MDIGGWRVPSVSSSGGSSDSGVDGALSYAGINGYLTNSPMANGGVVATEALELCLLMRVTAGIQVDQLLVNVGNAGSTGALFRMGLRTFDPATPTTPGTIIVDAGTVVATSTGTKTLTITPVTLDDMVWFSITAQGGATTVARAYGVHEAAAARIITGTLISNGVTNAHATKSGVTGALADPFGTPGRHDIRQTPAVFMRRSA